MKIILISSLVLLGLLNCQLSSKKVTHIVELAISINNNSQGSLKVNLFGDDVPRTVTNFVEICRGQRNRWSDPSQKMSYDGVPFHRVIPGFMMQSGDFTLKNGRGGESIYGMQFEDENFNLRSEEYSLAMANAGPNTNGSQFFITYITTPWLDGKHVVFGKLKQESEALAKTIEQYGSQGGSTSANVVIDKCTVQTV